MKKYIAEFFGTFVLVFVGCGTVVFSAPTVGHVGIALAFGLAVMAMVYTIGQVSGAHMNPAVTLGVFSAGRMKLADAIAYIVYQFAGAIVAAATLVYMTKGYLAGYDVTVNGLGQNGWGPTYGGGYDMITAIIFEFIATFIFVKVILKTTECDLRIAGVVIGLTLAMIHILGLPITGVSVNPARSFGPAMFVQGLALQQLWLFLAVPSVAGIFAGLCSRCCCGKCNYEPEVKTVKVEKVITEKSEAPVAKKSAPAHRTRRAPTRRR